MVDPEVLIENISSITPEPDTQSTKYGAQKDIKKYTSQYHYELRTSQAMYVKRVVKQ